MHFWKKNGIKPFLGIWKVGEVEVGKWPAAKQNTRIWPVIYNNIVECQMDSISWMSGYRALIDSSTCAACG